MNITTAKNILRETIRSNMKAKLGGTPVARLLNPLLMGNPGIGKTEAWEQAAEELNVECRTVIVAQYDAGEMGGMPFLAKNKDTGESEYQRARPDWLPSAGTGVLVLDELTQAPHSVLNIVAQLVNEHRIGEHALGDGWVIGGACNLLSNRAATNTLPAHVKDRFMFLPVEAEATSVIDRFNHLKLPSEMTSFLRDMPQLVEKFNPKADASPSPRSWVRVASIMGLSLPLNEKRLMIEGTVGESACNDFMVHLELHEDMVDPESVLSSPLTAELPSNASLSYILCAALSARANPKNIENILIYSQRLPNQEHILFLIKDSLVRTGGKASKLMADKAMRKWMETNGRELVL